MKTLTQTKAPGQLADSRRYNTMCVCQICTCGQHHCPTSTHKPFVGQTTYHHDFKPCTGIINQIKKPCTSHYHERHYDPELLKTSYDRQFVPQQIENRPISPNKYDYRPRTAKFYGETQYNKSYQPKQVLRQKPKPYTNLYTPNRSKFQGTTTYNAEFSPKKAQNTNLPQSYPYERRKVPFTGKTTYNAEFVPYPISPTWKNGESTGGWHDPNSPARKSRFQGESDYKASYKPYQIQRINHCPVLDLPQMPRQCSPGKTHVNYSAQRNIWQ